jgi:RNA polymerase sigma factor (sigma-70 family)
MGLKWCPEPGVPISSIGLMDEKPPAPPLVDLARSVGFVEFFRTHRRTLHAICLRCARGNSAVADDLLGEAALRALQALASGMMVVDPVAWWATIIRNAARDELRRRSTRNEISADEWDSEADPAVDGDALLLVRDRLKATFDGITILPEPQRRALALRTAGSSYEEIARALEVSLVNARRLVHVARRRLRSDDPAASTEGVELSPARWKWLSLRSAAPGRCGVRRSEKRPLPRPPEKAA